MRRVVSFGELLLRLSPPGHERFFQSPYLRTGFGGAEANVAASLAHFGLRSEYVTRLPANALGDAALQAVRAEGADVGRAVRGGTRLGLYFVEPGADLRPLRVVYDRANSAFSQIAAADVDWDAVLRDADWFHVSGVTAALGEGPLACVHAALTAARTHRVTTSLDLNYRPALWTGRDPRAVMQPLARSCDVLIANPGAVQTMLGIETAGTMPEPPAALRDTAAEVARAYGCARVALTQREVVSAGEHGWSATLFDAATGEFHCSERYQVRLVDRVGGGDSFAAGLIYAFLCGRAPYAALRFAVAASALKLTIPGDFNRVTVDEVDRLLESRE